MNTSSRCNLLSPFGALFATILPAAVLILSAQTSGAGSATWLLTPGGNDWNTPAHWTAGGPPNGPSDTATFSLSNTPASVLSQNAEVEGIVFDAAASPFTIKMPYTAGHLTISGTGITNNSGNTQNFIVRQGLSFRNTATAGSLTHIWMVNSAYSGFYESSTAGNGAFTIAANPPDNSGYTGGQMEFRDSSTAGNGTFTVNGFLFCGSGSGAVSFGDNATAGNGTFTNNAGASCGGNGSGGGLILFYDSASAENGTFTNKGGTAPGQLGARTIFAGPSTAGNATLIAEGGTDGGTGGSIQFQDNTANPSLGGTSRVEVFGDGNLDIRGTGYYASTLLTVGSIEGTGLVSLGNSRLGVGSNNLSTSFSGVIQKGNVGSGAGGSLTKVGSGTLTLSGANTYEGGTVITGGILEAVAGALGAGNVSLDTVGAALRFQGGATNNYIANAANLSVVSGSTLDLNFVGVPDTIGSLLLDGVIQPPGVYGSASSGAPHPLPQLTGAGTIQVTTSTASALQIQNASSRKTHGSAGNLDMPLALSGEPTVECRNSGGNHTLIFYFTGTVVRGNAAVTSGTGSVAAAPTFSESIMTVNLTGVADMQRVTVTLRGVTDNATNVMPDKAVTVTFLVGDTNADRFVNTGDALQTRSRSGQAPNVNTFRSDVNADGFLNSGDTTVVRGRSGNFVP